METKGKSKRTLWVAVCTSAILCLSLDGYSHMRLDAPEQEGGENFFPNQTYEIRWDAYIFHAPGVINLELSTDNGQNFSSIVSGIPILSDEESADSYFWTVPDVESTQCRIRAIYDYGGIDYTDTSGAFTISETTLDEVWVDFATSGAEDGTVTYPFDMVSDALSLVADGGTITINSNSADLVTNETPTLGSDGKAMVIKADGAGTVRIGDVSAKNASSSPWKSFTDFLGALVEAFGDASGGEGEIEGEAY